MARSIGVTRRLTPPESRHGSLRWSHATARSVGATRRVAPPEPRDRSLRAARSPSSRRGPHAPLPPVAVRGARRSFNARPMWDMETDQAGAELVQHLEAPTPGLYGASRHGVAGGTVGHARRARARRWGRDIGPAAANPDPSRGRPRPVFVPPRGVRLARASGPGAPAPPRARSSIAAT